MCDQHSLPVPPDAYDKVPLFIDSDDPLHQFGQTELSQALRTARENPWVAEWLFADHARPFHSQVPVPPESFDNALAIHLHHDISTPDQCAPIEPYDRIALPSTPENKKLVFSKDIDLLLVPVARLDGVTVGYTFIRGIREGSVQASMRPSFGRVVEPPFEFGAPMFIPGRFTFHNERRDYLMVVNELSSYMTGLISMRWRTKTTRDRCFFAIPKSNYGANNLPSRVFSVQCNVDHAINTSSNVNGIIHSECTQQTSSTEPIDSHPTANPAYKHLQQQSPKPMPMDFGLNSNGEPGLELEPVLEPREQIVPDPFFKFDTNLDITWAQGLETIGTIIPPGDANDLPDLMHDIFPNTNFEDMEQLFNMTNTPRSNESPFPAVQEEPYSVSPATSSLTLASKSNSVEQASGSVPSADLENGDHGSSWLLSTDVSGTPDGVGVPRRPGASDTSSGAFNMTALYDSLQSIESSLKGNFFSPKVRKDIMHPQTGELLSRTTGQLRAKFETIDPFRLKVFREIAAQSYYSSVMPLSSDNLLLPMMQPLPVSDSIAKGGMVANPNPIGQRPIFKRVAPAPLAPRPVPIVAASVSATPDEHVSAKSIEEAARQAKLEAKRIKNRMSAARSNQRRRAQLEAQRKELAALRQRVEELTNKKHMVLEENKVLRRQVQES